MKPAALNTPAPGPAPDAAARYRFPKTPWHSPLPDPAARPPAAPPVFEPIADDEEVERRIVLHHRKRRSWGTRLGLALVYACSIVLVLAAGLITAAWVEENGGLGATVAMLVSKPVASGERTTDNPRGQPSRHELPYDGQSPDDDKHLAARTATPIDTKAMQEKEPAAQKPASPPAAVGPATTMANGGAESRQAAPVSSGSGAAGETATSKEPVKPAPAAQPPGRKPAGGDKSVAAAKTPARPQVSPQRVARGKEISRIQRQAAEELKKKTRNRQHAAVAQAKASSGTPRAAKQRARYASSLAQCNRSGNIFRREQCKWQICAGKWGKGGCPSYVAARFTAD